MKDPYVYEGTDVLINKLGIKDNATLDKAESDFVSIAASKLRNDDFQISSILDGLKIHKHFFLVYMNGQEVQGQLTFIKVKHYLTVELLIMFLLHILCKL